MRGAREGLVVWFPAAKRETSTVRSVLVGFQTRPVVCQYVSFLPGLRETPLRIESVAVSGSRVKGKREPSPVTLSTVTTYPSAAPRSTSSSMRPIETSACVNASTLSCMKRASSLLKSTGVPTCVPRVSKSVASAEQPPLDGHVTETLVRKSLDREGSCETATLCPRSPARRSSFAGVTWTATPYVPASAMFAVRPLMRRGWSEEIRSAPTASSPQRSSRIFENVRVSPGSAT